MKKADIAGWYKHSPAPGEMGPAIIVGHVDSDEGPAVFYELASLRRGDEIRVRRSDGVIAVFTVDRVASYPKEDFPRHKVYGDIRHAGLRLITCGGSYDEDSIGYLNNVVAYASLDHLEDAAGRGRAVAFQH